MSTTFDKPLYDAIIDAATRVRERDLARGSGQYWISINFGFEGERYCLTLEQNYRDGSTTVAQATGENLTVTLNALLEKTNQWAAPLLSSVTRNA